MSLALIFPGQGSQYVGMGRALAGSEPAARRVLDEADEILGFSLSALMAEGPAIAFHDARFPVVWNATAEPVSRGAQARELLIRQLTSAVRWSDSIRAMVDAGADRFLELGPCRVLCGLDRRNAKGLPCNAVGEPEDISALEADA